MFKLKLLFEFNILTFQVSALFNYVSVLWGKTFKLYRGGF